MFQDGDIANIYAWNHDNKYQGMFLQSSTRWPYGAPY